MHRIFQIPAIIPDVNCTPDTIAIASPCSDDLLVVSKLLETDSVALSNCDRKFYDPELVFPNLEKTYHPIESFFQLAR